MEELKDLVHIVAKERLKKVDDMHHFSSGKGKTSMINKIYHGILRGNIASDSDAARMLNHTEGSLAFRSFKSRFRRKLYNSLYLLDLSGKDSSDYYKASYECSRGQHFVRVLTWLSARKAAIRLSERMLTKAIKFELSEYVVFFLKNLVQKASDTENKHDFYKFGYQLEYWRQLWLIEEEATMAYYNMQISYAGTIARQLSAGKVAIEASIKIEEKLNAYDSYLIRLHLSRLKGHGNYILGRFQDSIDAWNALDKYFDDYPIFATNIREGEIALQKIICYMHLKEYDKGIELASNCFNLFETGTINRLVFYEIFFILLMHGGKYNEAREAQDAAIKEIKLKELPIMHQQKWKLYEAYLYFTLGEIKGNDQKAFKLSKFINETNALSHDKKGMNVSLLIIQICIYLKKGNNNGLIDSMQSLKLYKSRYIKKDSSMRMRILIRMLFILEECDYKYERVIKQSAIWLKKLHLTSFTYSGSFEGIEVLRFEKLWDLILEYLEK